MIRRIYKAGILAVLLAAAACGLDNYDEPASRLTGKVVYGDLVPGLSHGKVSFNLYQEGYDKNSPIRVRVAQDGTFSALLFDGEYRMEAIAGSGPWRDDIRPVRFKVRGATSLEIAVTPYYILSDVQIALNGTEVRSVCNVVSVAPEKELQRLFLCVGATPFISDQSYSYALRKNLMPVAPGGCSLSADIAELLEKYDTLYARLGLQIDGSQECIYSETVKIK